MARADGGIDRDILGDLLVRGQVDAAHQGAKSFSGPLGTPDESAKAAARDVTSGTTAAADELARRSSQIASRTQRRAARTAREFRLTISALREIERGLDEILDDLDAIAGTLGRLPTDGAMIRSMALSAVTGQAVLTAAIAGAATIKGLTHTGRWLLPVFTRIAASVQAAEDVIGLSLDVAYGAAAAGTATAIRIGRVQVRIAGRLLTVPASTALSIVGGLTYVTGWRAAMAAGLLGSTTALASGTVASVERSLRNAAGELGRGILTDPGALDSPSEWLRGAALILRNVKDGLDPDAIEDGIGRTLPDTGLLSYQSILALFSNAWTLTGKSDRSIRSVTPNRAQRAQMNAARDRYRAKLRAAHPRLSNRYGQLSTVGDVFANAGEIDALGENRAAVIRVMVNHGPPVTLTLILPSTKDWYSTSKVPNDLASNIAIMAGADSALLRAAEHALRSTMKDLRLDPSSVAVMVAGFSQGGITAARFAQRYHRDFAIKQVVTAGAPVARIPLPEGVSALSFENASDKVVPRLDMKRNNETKQHKTVRGRAGGHSAADYAETALDQQAAYARHGSVQRFLAKGGDRVTAHDHYVVRGR
ncbi:hypothetical protein GCM10010401_00290 [Rarobacter faecitabidus]|uniref:Uncharacterized protein n=1 Tax=Rarobacter faecitabidus TaxID=13243 RepID=A0A542ZX96_RARFA|nr:hypothetical protein [Rarobacter faecitabidus]TQL64830.1 hypothetical protein FB461_1353 [Rarobacter faecitabidus]